MGSSTGSAAGAVPVVAPSSELKIGDRIRLAHRPPYFKTAEPMPMMRPPDLIALGEEGTIEDLRVGGYWVIRFSRGIFLMDAQYLEIVSSVD
jgi:hypothetical protein